MAWLPGPASLLPGWVAWGQKAEMGYSCLKEGVVLSWGGPAGPQESGRSEGESRNKANHGQLGHRHGEGGRHGSVTEVSVSPPRRGVGGVTDPQ